MAEYNFIDIEKKWQKKWEDKKIFQVEKNSKNKFYVLDMFPYPSGTGLHMGHAFVFSLGDIYARFKRMNQYNVLYPIGYDSFGLPAENAAIKAGILPEEYTRKAIENFQKQQRAMGWSYDWNRMFKTSDSQFYRWDQWIFLKMFEKGIAYRKKAPVNWCPKCETVLANEQVIGGKCWRHEDTSVEVKHLEQWFFRITDYAEELLDKLDDLNWPERAKLMQRNWIGKSHGAEIDFEVNNEKWPIFTTRPDTIFGVTFLVISAQHHRLMEIVTDKQEKEVKNFLKKLKSVSEKELENMEKDGVFTGSYAIHPLTKEKIPIYAGNFVISDYGSGMVMAVPAHDKRDFDFALKYDLSMKVVIEPKDSEIYERNGQLASAYEGEGFLINSGKYDGISNKEAKEKITKELEKQKLGRKQIQFKLRDWLISRQRYWGTPIPIIYCDKCGIVPIDEKDLPIKLPKEVKFGKGNPLITNEKWLNVKCPKCKGKARRETDTMDTFVNSSWYYLRYTDPFNDKEIFDIKNANYWAPIDQYIGGPEHITCHLLYMRFYTKFLRDIGLLDFDEPALKYFTQGIVKGSDGEKMSKSAGNVIEPLETIKKFGADSLRMYLVSNSSPDKDFDWNDKEMSGSSRFINKIFNYFSEIKFNKIDRKIESKLNKMIKNVTEYVENFKHNLAVIELRNFFNYISEKSIDKKTGLDFLKLLSIYCPFVTEELWEKLGNKGFIALAKWPEVDEGKIDDSLEKEEKTVEDLINDINNIKKILNYSLIKTTIYAIPLEVSFLEENISSIAHSTGSKDIKIFAVNDKNKYDPENKSKRAKPGKPAIFIEPLIE